MAGDDLVVTALFLGVRSSSLTAKDDQPAPIGRRHSSTGGDAVQSVLIRAANYAVACGSAKAGPVGFRLDCCWRRRGCRRLVPALGKEPLLGSLRPPPREIVIKVGCKATSPDERPHSAGDQNGRNHDYRSAACDSQTNDRKLAN